MIGITPLPEAGAIEAPAATLIARGTMSRMPSFDWCISGSRLPSLFLVDDGAAISLASTMVPSRIIKPFSAKWPLIVSKI